MRSGISTTPMINPSPVRPSFSQNDCKSFDPAKPINPDGSQSSGRDEGKGRNDNKEDSAQRNGHSRGSRRKMGLRPRVKPPIQDIFQRGDEVLVQVMDAVRSYRVDEPGEFKRAELFPEISIGDAPYMAAAGG